MKKIMKRAWEIYRTLEGNRLARLSYALKQAHKEAKQPTPEEIKKTLEAQGLKVTRWTKNGNDRFYVKGFHFSKEYYIDLTNMTAKGNKAGTNSDMANHFEAAKLQIKII